MMDPVSISEMRAAKKDDPRLWSPKEALQKALRDLEDGSVEAEHVMILYGGHDPKGGSNCGFYQAGGFRPFEQLGLLQTISNSIMQKD